MLTHFLPVQMKWGPIIMPDPIFFVNDIVVPNR